MHETPSKPSSHGETGKKDGDSKNAERVSARSHACARVRFRETPLRRVIATARHVGAEPARKVAGASNGERQRRMEARDTEWRE
jgi:hypothetical protein